MKFNCSLVCVNTLREFDLSDVFCPSLEIFTQMEMLLLLMKSLIFSPYNWHSWPLSSKGSYVCHSLWKDICFKDNSKDWRIHSVAINFNV